MAPQACPGAWRSAPPPLRRNPSPRNPRRRGSLTERVNGSTGQGHLKGAAGRRAEPRSATADAGAASRQTKPEMAKRSDPANGEAPRAALRPPRSARPPARLGAAQRRSGPSPSTASAPPPPGPPGLAWPLPPGDSAHPSTPPCWGLHENKKKEKENAFSFFLLWQGGRVETFESFLPPARTHLRSHREELGWGAGAGAGERGLKAQALQRPTRAYTPPPVPAEKSSSYPRLHRSAFLFQSMIAWRLLHSPAKPAA